MSICEHELLSNEFKKPSVKSRGNHRFMVDYGNIASLQNLVGFRVLLVGMVA